MALFNNKARRICRRVGYLLLAGHGAGVGIIAIAILILIALIFIF